MDKVTVARDVALKLSEAEGAIDLAIAKTCNLLEALASGRRDLRISAVVGGEAADHLAASIAALTTARREAVAAHEALASVQTQLGLRRLDLSVDMMGPLDKPPAPSGRVAEPGPDGLRPIPPLRAV